MPSSRPDTRAVVAPFALLRVAAISYDRLEAMAPPLTSARVEAALAARAELERLRPGVEDLLFTLVPLIEDRKLRGAVVRMKRDVHGGRAPSLAADDRGRLLAYAAAPGRAALEAWLAASDREVVGMTEAERILPDEIRSHVRASLRRISADEAFLRPLALASPELVLQLFREATRPPDGPDPSRSDRAVLGYAIRAAAKTSPFSTFMHVGGAAVSRDATPRAPSIEGVGRESRARVNRGILARAYRAATARCPDPTLFPLCKNPTLASGGDGKIEALAGEYSVMNGRPWRGDRRARFRFHARLAEALVALPARFTRAELLARLCDEGLTPARAEEFAIRLIATGLVLTTACTDAFDATPERGLLASLDGASSPEAHGVRAEIDDMTRHARAFAGAGAAERLTILRDVARGEERTYAALHVPPPAANKNPVLEDGAFTGPCGALGGPLHGLLQELGDHLGEFMELGSEYLRIRDAFVAAYGVGGRCDDVRHFVVDHGERLLAGYFEAGAGAKQFPTSPRPAGVRAGVTAYVQLAAPDAAAAAEGRAQLIVNKVYPGLGWLSARHASAGDPALGQAMTDWLVEACAPREPVELVVCGECNDLQAHPRLTRRVVGWPVEPFLEGTRGVIPLHEITVRHDPQTGLLELSDADGRALAPVYLGGALPSPSWGFAYFLTKLAFPFELQRPDVTPPPDPAVEIFSRPRRHSGRIVMGRATTWMRGRRLASTWFRQSGARRLLDVATDCAAHGIPRTCFAHAWAAPSIDPRAVVSDTSKPLWIDTRNPFSLDMLERLASEAEWVVLTEALPDPNALWLTREGERHVSELQIELLV